MRESWPRPDIVTGGSARNWKGYGSLVDLTTHGAVEQAILTDPQTSGGLLVACAPESVNEVLDCFQPTAFIARRSSARSKPGHRRVGGVARVGRARDAQ